MNYREHNIDLNLDDRNALLLRVGLHSCQSNSIKYFVYILLDKWLSGLSTILRQYCTKVVCQEVGCCFHIMVIIWHFGYAKYLQNIHLPAYNPSSIFEDNASSDSVDEDKVS